MQSQKVEDVCRIFMLTLIQNSYGSARRVINGKQLLILSKKEDGARIAIEKACQVKQLTGKKAIGHI
ncbi:hypothetical protein D3C76_1796330 [compost metagenome]